MSGAGTLSGKLRQMLAVLEEERQALAALDLDGITLASSGKQDLCDALEGELDEECRALLLAAQQKNEVNRRIRNLMAANVAARLEALSGACATYSRPSLRRA